jgi:hypothetical protein
MFGWKRPNGVINSMRTVLAFLCLAVSLAVLSPQSIGQERPAWAPYPNVLGVWTGKAYFMVPDGHTDQFHRFEFTEQNGAFLKGTHAWEIIGKNLKSHDGSKHTYEATEPMLGVITQDGTIHLVEHGDHTRFQMRLLNNHTMDFIATEGGEHPLVGHGVLVRE